MSLFKKNTHAEKYPFNPETEEPFIHANTCNRDMVAGFKEKNSGVFHEVMLIKDKKDIEEFKASYGIKGDIHMSGNM